MRESDTPCLSAHMLFSCTDTLQYIQVVSAHIRDNVVAVFSQCAQIQFKHGVPLHTNLHVLLSKCGVRLQSPKPPFFFFKDVNIYLEISLQKIQFCENHPSISWFTLMDIVHNDKINVLSKINGIC